jgi:hypothetical protein
MDEAEIFSRINDLATEERKLFSREAQGRVTDAERDRLRKLEVTLDQCWDLLRQRRARAEAGLNPEEAAVRDAGTVEGYVS